MSHQAVDIPEPVMVARIQVNVVSDEISVDPPSLRVPRGKCCLIVWVLNDPGNRWKFLGHGISFKDGRDGQFTGLLNSKDGDKVIHFDRNTKEGPYPYTVALTDRKYERAILEDPIIENEGDG